MEEALLALVLAGVTRGRAIIPSLASIRAPG